MGLWKWLDLYKNKPGGCLDQIETVRRVYLIFETWIKKTDIPCQSRLSCSANRHNEVLHESYLSNHRYNKNKPEIISNYINDMLNGECLIFECIYDSLFLEVKWISKEGFQI